MLYPAELRRPMQFTRYRLSNVCRAIESEHSIPCAAERYCVYDTTAGQEMSRQSMRFHVVGDNMIKPEYFHPETRRFALTNRTKYDMIGMIKQQEVIL